MKEPKQRCPHADVHTSKSYKIMLDHLVTEDNADYIKPGCYLHNNNCQVCGRKYVRKQNTKNSTRGVTIDNRNPAHKCEHQAKYGCNIVWCHDCFVKQHRNNN